MAQYKFSTLKPEYDRYWRAMKVTQVAAARSAARRIIALRPRYEKIQAMTGVPWYAIGLMHLRESNLNFNTWLHNGDPMRNRDGVPIRTVRVPAGRPPNPNVSFEDGAYDALVTVKGFNKIKDWGAARIAYINESYNGFGYRSPARNIPSPYLWGGTNIQKRGKFIRDRVYDPDTWDTQLGVMAVLWAILDLTGIKLPDDGPAAPLPVPADARRPGERESPAAVEPADGGVRPPERSRTVWGGIISTVSGIVGTASAAFAYLNNPYALTAFGILVAIALIGVFMVVRGYIDVRAVVKHLTPDTATGTTADVPIISDEG